MSINTYSITIRWSGPIQIFAPLKTGQILSLLLIVTVVAGGIFTMQAFYMNKPDIPQHINFILRSIESGVWDSYTTLHKLVYAISPSPKTYFSLGWTMTTVLTIAVVAKALVGASILRTASKRLVIPATFIFVLATPIFNFQIGRVYLGQITSTLWHNPTSIFSVPFNIWLFTSAICFFRKPNWFWTIMLTIAGILSTSAKPSFAIALFPALGLIAAYVCIRQPAEARKILTLLLAPFLASAVVVSLQYMLTYGTDPNSEIIFSWLGVWSRYSPNIMVSLALSIAFPATTVLLFPQKAVHDFDLIFAWLVFSIATLQFAVLAEGGPRFGHGNFGWGASLSMTVLFLFSLRLVLAQPLERKQIVALGVFGLHGLSGIYYFAQIVLGGSFR